MALGDSITKADRVPGGYLTKLDANLTRDKVPHTFAGSQDGKYPNEGHTGFWIANLTQGAAGWVKLASPDVVVIMAGTNDLLNGEEASAPAALNQLVSTVHAAAPNARIVVSTIPVLKGHEDAVAAFNASIASTQGAKVVAGGLNFTEDKLVDGVHPGTQSGYDKFADAITPAVEGR